MEWRPFFRS
jgi:hypothetical protein